MRIGLDARYLSHGITGGVRTYVFHLAQSLPGVAPEHEFFYYADRKAAFELDSLPRNVTLRLLPWRSTLSSLRNDRLISRWMENDRVDVAHFPANYGVPGKYGFVVTLHDTFNLFSMREHLRGFGASPRKVALMAYLGYQTRRTLALRPNLIAVSTHAMRDICQRTKFPPEKVQVVHEAADPIFQPMRDRKVLAELRRKYRLRPRIILADGIKNPSAAVRAFKRIVPSQQQSVHLVFFSREATPRQEIEAHLADPGILFVPQPSTSELVYWMNLADVFLFPSWYEGFGLPIVEAMQCGTPVIGSSRGSIPEIVGDGGEIFSLEDEGSLPRLIEDVLGNDEHRRRLSERALRRARRFSWDRASRDTLDVYRASFETRVGIDKPVSKGLTLGCANE